MTPDQLQAAVGAAIGVPLLILVCKYAWGIITSTRDRLDMVEKDGIKKDTIIEGLKSDVTTLTSELKTTQTQQVRHDEQIKTANNTMDEMKSDLKDINTKIDILIQRK